VKYFEDNPELAAIVSQQVRENLDLSSMGFAAQSGDEEIEIEVELEEQEMEQEEEMQATKKKK
jgi:recombination protein RecA